MNGPGAMVPEPTRRVRVGRWSAELLPRQPYQARYTADRPVLGFAYESQDGVHAYASDRIRPFHARPNGLAYVPKGCEVFSRSPVGGEYLVLTGFDLEAASDFPFSDRIVEAGLDGELTVQDLADNLGLSAGFFSRAFKAATGRSPHAYIIDRRLARVRLLLASGAEDLSAVALETGFSSHAHLTTAFRQRLGPCPSTLRRSLAAGRPSGPTPPPT